MSETKQVRKLSLFEFDSMINIMKMADKIPQDHAVIFSKLSDRRKEIFKAQIDEDEKIRQESLADGKDTYKHPKSWEKEIEIEFSLAQLRCIGDVFLRVMGQGEFPKGELPKGVLPGDIRIAIWNLSSTDKLYLQRYIEKQAKIDNAKTLDYEFLPDDGLTMPVQEPGESQETAPANAA